MGISLDDVQAALPASERRAVQVWTEALIAQEMSLRDLRKAFGRTQVAMAKRLGIKQENVSRIEQRPDMLLSTLDKYLRSMGGRLRLVAEFDDRPSVVLAGFSSVTDREEAAQTD